MEKVLAELPALINSAFGVLSYIQKVRAAAQQTAEWSPELEQNYQLLLDTAKDSPQWQPDPVESVPPAEPPASDGPS